LAQKQVQQGRCQVDDEKRRKKEEHQGEDDQDRKPTARLLSASPPPISQQDALHAQRLRQRRSQTIGLPDGRGEGS
jgi:hypothetical protein